LGDCSFYCEAGAEIGVASTKCFTSQLLILIMFALHCATKKGNLKKMEISALYRIIKDIPNNIREVLKKSDNIKNISNSIADSENIITIGRNVSYGLSLECALKIKEISYIPVDAVSAGELKHGTLALVDEETPVIVFAIPDFTFVKTISNMEEILSRKGKVILISDRESIDLFEGRLYSSINVKDDNYLTATMSYAIVLQLLALFIAEKKGHNVDKPRNLAKSVTVE
jgi:glucosamine--fructose-6-phosphate aminotransferase (isomerizing)